MKDRFLSGPFFYCFHTIKSFAGIVQLLVILGITNLKTIEA